MAIKLKKFEQHFGGLHWIYENELGETLSIICHTGSYGWESGDGTLIGKFEIMASWKRDVLGYLSFNDIAKWIRRLDKRGIRKSL